MAGVSQPSPLLAARQRALALLGTGEFAGARAVLEHAVAVGKSNLGEDDPDVLATLHQLARLHQQADDPAAARRVLEEAYAAGQWRLGETDPLMLEISFDLGFVAEELGNRHEARKAFSRVADTGAAVLGADHWAVLRARAYLGDDPQTPPPTQQPPNQYQPPADPNSQDPISYASSERMPIPPAPAGPLQPIERTPIPNPAVQQGPGPVRPGWARWSDPHQGQPDQAPRPAPTPDMTRQPGGERQLSVYHPALTEPTAGQPLAAPIPHMVPTNAEPAVLVSQLSGGTPYRKRGVALYAAIAASLAAVIAVVALVFVLANRGGDAPDNVPTLGGPPPTDVRLIDKGSSVEVTWSDPANGKVTFLVTMGRPGELLKPTGQVGPGQTSYQLNGLNAKLDYCFAVVAVYRTDKVSVSPQSCTSRSAPK
jgi:hypothetical protein